MRKLVFYTLLISVPLMAIEPCSESKQKGCAAGYASRDATAISMLGWGLGIAIAIALICALIDDHPSSSS